MFERIAWLILAGVHALPAYAFFKPSMLSTLYGLKAGNPLFVLMHHRAALFVLVFAACIWALFDVPSRRLASVAVAISMISFLWLYWQAGSPAPLRRIAVVDLIGLPALAFVAWRAFKT